MSWPNLLLLTFLFVVVNDITRHLQAHETQFPIPHSFNMFFFLNATKLNKQLFRETKKYIFRSWLKTRQIGFLEVLQEEKPDILLATARNMFFASRTPRFCPIHIFSNATKQLTTLNQKLHYRLS